MASGTDDKMILIDAKRLVKIELQQEGQESSQSNVPERHSEESEGASLSKKQTEDNSTKSNENRSAKKKT